MIRRLLRWLGFRPRFGRKVQAIRDERPMRTYPGVERRTAGDLRGRIEAARET